MMPTETFYITMIGIVTTFLGVVLRYAYKSKCQRVDFCGVHIERDTESELQEDLARRADNSGSPKSRVIMLGNPRRQNV